MAVGDAFAKISKKQNNISFSDSLYNSIQWRLIGPFRGGRAGTVAGVANTWIRRLLLTEIFKDLF